MSQHPPLPVEDDVSAPYWAAIQQRRLVVQRCASCQTLQFPPNAECGSCASADLNFEQVSGRGKVFSFTETVSGARHPYFQSISPYLVGMIQLDDGPGLIFPSNFPGSEYTDLKVGAPVDLTFQEVGEGVIIPQFKVVE